MPTTFCLRGRADAPTTTTPTQTPNTCATEVHQHHVITAEFICNLLPAVQHAVGQWWCDSFLQVTRVDALARACTLSARHSQPSLCRLDELQSLAPTIAGFTTGHHLLRHHHHRRHVHCRLHNHRHHYGRLNCCWRPFGRGGASSILSIAPPGHRGPYVLSITPIRHSRGSYVLSVAPPGHS